MTDLAKAGLKDEFSRSASYVNYKEKEEAQKPETEDNGGNEEPNEFNEIVDDYKTLTEKKSESKMVLEHLMEEMKRQTQMQLPSKRDYLDRVTNHLQPDD